MADARWFVVHTYSGYENKVASNIATVVENRNMQDQIFEVRIPTEIVTEIKDDKVREIERKLFPGYVMVKVATIYKKCGENDEDEELGMTDEAWYVIRNTRGVTGFVGPGSKPVPLTEAEMKPLGIKMENVSVDFDEGDTIAVVAGVWKDTVGVVQKMDYSKQTATINVELFGRETPVEISFAEVRSM